MRALRFLTSLVAVLAMVWVGSAPAHAQMGAPGATSQRLQWPKGPRSGVTVIFLPGMGTSAFRDQPDGTFDQLKAMLLSAGFQPGDFVDFGYNGTSVFLDGTTAIQPYSCEDVVRNKLTPSHHLYTLIDRLAETRPGEKVAIVGHSYGGIQVLWHLIRANERGSAGNVRLAMTVDSPLEGLNFSQGMVAEGRGACFGGEGLTLLRQMSVGRENQRLANEQTVQGARRLGIVTATVGNRQDCIYSPTFCNAGGIVRTGAVGTGMVTVAACSTVVGCLVPIGSALKAWSDSKEDWRRQLIPSADLSGVWDLSTGPTIDTSHSLALNAPESLTWIAQQLSAVRFS